MDLAVRTGVSALEIARRLNNNQEKVAMQCEQCHYQFNVSNNPALNKLCPYCGSNWVKIRENEVEKIVGSIV
ncbi:hypothetical protein HYU13_01045 [Candidatus Woesearchaeota archaeon]|nr:hypothetical protein [Candidatus Woesearchaeota archaeon]